jgi:hypothetical protein
MGSLCSACKKLQEEKEEDAPLLSHDQAAEQRGGLVEEVESSEVQSAKYYQSIIDDANGKFITSLRYRNRPTSNADDMRYKLESAVVDESLILSPPSANLFKAKEGGNNNTNLSSINIYHNNKSPVDILSEPVIVNDKLDLGMDEIAEITSSWMSANAINSRGGGGEGDEEGCVAFLTAGKAP